MTMRNAVRAGLLPILMALGAAVVPGAGGQDAPIRTGGIQDQFSISLPDGWSVYDQDEAVSGKASPLGVVFFSARPVTQPGSTTEDAPLLAKVDTGETSRRLLRGQFRGV